MAGDDLILPIAAPGPPGEVVVAPVVVAKVAGSAARATYGVVRMESSPMRRLARLIKGSLTEGVGVDIEEGAARIELHVAMERGVNLAQVTANLQEQVRYQVEQVAGVPVSDITVRVEDLED
jgi:uncharacterized alkaline shock family protein YloU